MGDRAQTEVLAQRATERLQALEREADQLASQEKTLLGDLRRLDLDRQIKGEELRRIDADAAQVGAELAEATARVDELQRRDTAHRPEFRARLVEIYKLGSARYARLLLSTSDVRRLGEASRVVAALAQQDRNRVADRQQTLNGLKTTRAALEGRRLQLATLRQDAARAETTARAAAQARDDRIREIDRRRDLNAQLSGELRAAQQKLQATLRGMSTAAAPPPPPSAPAVLPIKPFKGDLDWPLSGTVRRRFDRSAIRRAGTANGIEIAAEGSPVLAVHDGVVAFADAFSGFGNLVILEHGPETFSVYGHLLDIVVKKGQHVQRGQAVGGVGTPLAAPAGSPGLYFELRIDGEPVDPVQWFKKRP